MGVHVTPLELSLDFPRPACPFLETAVNHTANWISELGVIDERGVRQLLRDGIIDAGPLLVPTASLSQACLVSDLTAFLILLDDEFDGREAASDPRLAEHLVAPVLNAYRGDLAQFDRCPDHMKGLARAAHDLGCRFALIPSKPTWQQRLSKDIEAHISSKTVEARQRASGEPLDVAAYLQLRHITGAAYAYTDLVEMTEQVTIPEVIRSSPEWERLYAATADVFVGIQDICSHAKELATGESLNLVAVMQRAGLCELDEAVDRASHWLSMRAEEFRDAGAAVASLADLTLGEPVSRQVTRYVEALELMLGGALEWNSGNNPRYTGTPRSGDT